MTPAAMSHSFGVQTTVPINPPAATYASCSAVVPKLRNRDWRMMRATQLGSGSPKWLSSPMLFGGDVVLAGLDASAVELGFSFDRRDIDSVAGSRRRRRHQATLVGTPMLTVKIGMA